MFLLALYHSARLHLLRAITNISHSATIITMFWKSSRIVFFFRLQVCRPAGQIPLLLWDIIRLIFWVTSEWLQLCLSCWQQRMWRILHQLCLQNKLSRWVSVLSLVWLIILVVLSTCWFDFSFVAGLHFKAINLLHSNKLIKI